MDKASETLQIAAAGLRAQASRMRVIAENVANADSTGRTAEEDPYRRQIPVFDAVMDRELNARVVRMDDVRPDQSEFKLVYEPGHPAADGEGYVKYPNVSSLIEMMDMREAMRSYEASVSVIEQSRAMMSRTVDLLRN